MGAIAGIVADSFYLTFCIIAAGGIVAAIVFIYDNLVTCRCVFPIGLSIIQNRWNLQKQ